LEEKISLIESWLRENGGEVLLVDTANDFFRGESNPSDERDVGRLFDGLRNLGLDTTMLIRHDGKKKDFDTEVHSNELIRISRMERRPEVILYSNRVEKRTNECHLAVGKVRYGQKPEPFHVWFDAKHFRLTPLPPVVAVREEGSKNRRQVLEECQLGLPGAY
jgi:hypothetical protein